MNASTSAACAAMGVTCLASTISNCPAQWYDCGQYTATLPVALGSWDSVSCVTNPMICTLPPTATSAGRSNRRCSPTNALSRSRLELYSRRTNGSLARVSSTSFSSDRVITVEARNPTSVISTSVTKSPTPGDREPEPPVDLVQHEPHDVGREGDWCEHDEATDEVRR